MNDLRFIGCGSGFHPELGSNSAWFREDDGTIVLLDCGETVYGSIMESDELRRSPAWKIMITHLHGDHVGSLASLAGWLHWERGVKPRIVIHQALGDSLKTLLGLQGIPVPFYDLKQVTDKPVHVFNDPLLMAEMDRVRHTDDMPAFSITFRRPEWLTYWSGDTADAEGIVAIMRSTSIDHVGRIYTDCSRSRNPVHVSLRTLSRVVQDPAWRDKITVMHLDGVDTSDEAKSLGFRSALDEITTDWYRS
jgi:hypothetical protein